MSERCSKTVHDGTFRGHSCRLKVTIHRDGLPFCAIHDPVVIAEKNKERDARWEKKWAEQEARELANKAAADQQRRESEAFRWLEAHQYSHRWFFHYGSKKWAIVVNATEVIEADTLLECVEAAMRKEPGK